MRRVVANPSGQATLELLLSSSLVLLTLTGAGWVLRAEWKRARCAYLVFESAHSRLKGIMRLPGGASASASISVAEDGDSVEGRGLCGEAKEQVRLLKLEEIRW